MMSRKRNSGSNSWVLPASIRSRFSGWGLIDAKGEDGTNELKFGVGHFDHQLSLMKRTDPFIESTERSFNTSILF